jgi:hypothetical protein
VLWNGFAGPVALTLPLFSCPLLPPRKPINPSLSSSFFFLPQILHATIPNPTRIIAPPIPQTTPMIVVLVCLLKPEEEVWFSDREAAFVDLALEDTVDEE